ncbi:hypothetical protein SAMN04488564_102612 [Lentzea waywayandensis]|uniref:Uncharacterized protein n=1 Tax=Lentzea waywayandensis TaxID=84724 RepID=A0A1I6DH54_9PSEU|nr:hypothetical protein [Lentzea waywayandensis]SFR04785.1 hypothetical protein SAMN04488564_102612 [Lentzea waywayandensis]
MNEPTFAEMFRAAQRRFVVHYERLTVEDTKTVMRDWINEMQRELDRWTHDIAADSEESLRADQLEEGMRLLKQSAMGMLLAIEMPQPAERAPRRSTGLDWLAGPPRPEPRPPQPTRIVRSQGFAKHVLHMCEALDATLEAARPRPPVAFVQPWGADGELVRLLHDLLSARQTGHGPKVLNRLDQLVDQLRDKHEIEIVAYDENVSQYFVLDPSPGFEDGEIRTVRPALRWRQQIVAAGEATRRPAGDTAPGGELPRISEGGR